MNQRNKELKALPQQSKKRWYKNDKKLSIANQFNLQSEKLELFQNGLPWTNECTVVVKNVPPETEDEVEIWNLYHLNSLFH